MNNDVENQQGQLYIVGSRGYSAYEVAVQNGFVGTEEEWLESLKGEQGEPGTPFGDLTPEQKEELRGEEGKSAYEVSVENGYQGTEEEWVNDFLTPDGYYNKEEVDEKFNNYVNIKNYGAKGNGLIDDTAAIQSAINQKGAIYFPDGTYLISSPLSIKNGVKSIVLSDGATITTNSVIESIILINNSSTNLVITGGTIDCNAKAKKGIYSTVYIGSPTFKDIMIKNATECGLQIRDENNIGGSCHGYLDRVKVYNKDTLATCIGLYAHDMQITDCELFYTNCGIEIKADMQIINGVHIWAGGSDNPNSNTYGIKYEPGDNSTQISLSNVYFDGMNVSVYATKGTINMDNIIFFNPEEGTYNNPVALLSKNMYSTYWNLGKYYLNAVVPMALLDYVTFDSNNMVSHNNIISKYTNSQIFKEGYIDFGCNYNCLTKNYIHITSSYVTNFITGKYYLFGYYLLRPTSTSRRGNIDIKITNKLHAINHEINIDFNYNSQDVVTISNEKITALNKGFRNPSFGISLGSIEEKTSILGNSVKVIPLYLYYDGEATNFTSTDCFMVTNLTKESPSCLMLFESIMQEEAINPVRTYRLASMYDGQLSQNTSTDIFITQKSVYKILLYSYGNSHLYDSFAEYNVTRFTGNTSIVKVFENGNITLPTITFDGTTELLTISAPAGQWYYVKAIQL